MDKKLFLESKHKDEIYMLAEKAGLSGFRKSSKAKVIQQLISLDNKTFDGILEKPSIWKRHHNHFYGFITVVSVVLAVLFYYKPLKLPKSLTANDITFKVYISGRHIDRQLLFKAPETWHAKASIGYFDYFDFDMNLVKDVYYPSSRGESIPQAVYKSSNVILPTSTTYGDKLENLDGLTLRINIPPDIINAFGGPGKITCSFEVQAPDNWYISGSKDCLGELEASFVEKN